MRDRPTLIALIVASIVFCASSCTRRGEQRQPETVSSSTQNSNEESKPRRLYTEQTARGDVERAGLAVETALDAARQNKLQRAVEYLEAAAQHIAKTTTAGRPDQQSAVRLQAQIDEIKGWIDAALKSARSGSTETTSRIVQVRTAIGALKVRMGQ